MRWKVGFTGITPSNRHLAGLLEGSGVELLVEGDKAYLVGSKLEQLMSRSDVLHEIERIRGVIAQVTSDVTGPEVSFRVESILETKEDGSTKFAQVLTPTAAEVRVVVPAAVFTAVITQELSEEERSRIEAERIEHEYQMWLEKTKPRTLAALHDEKALRVHRILQQELTSTRIGLIAEIIEDDLNGDVTDLVSKTRWSNLKASINHPSVLGDDSRHAVPKGAPPSNPMSLEECQALITEVAGCWFKQKALALVES